MRALKIRHISSPYCFKKKQIPTIYNLNIPKKNTGIDIQKLKIKKMETHFHMNNFVKENELCNISHAP
jgi:hypothetical protein